jgi:hypothetical protein
VLEVKDGRRIPLYSHLADPRLLRPVAPARVCKEIRAQSSSPPECESISSKANGLPIIIVDNASTAATLDRTFPEGVAIVRNSANLGTSEAIRIGFAHALEHEFDCPGCSMRIC